MGDVIVPGRDIRLTALSCFTGLRGFSHQEVKVARNANCASRPRALCRSTQTPPHDPFEHSLQNNKCGMHIPQQATLGRRRNFPQRRDSLRFGRGERDDAVIEDPSTSPSASRTKRHLDLGGAPHRECSVHGTTPRPPRTQVATFKKIKAHSVVHLTAPAF